MKTGATWLLILLFANGNNGGTVEVPMPSEQACKSSAGIVKNSMRRQNYEGSVYWACILLEEES